MVKIALQGEGDSDPLETVEVAEVVDFGQGRGNLKGEVAVTKGLFWWTFLTCARIICSTHVLCAGDKLSDL